MRDRALEAFTFFRDRGYSPEAAAGIAGNFAAESGFNVNAINPGDGSDGSDSIGLAQWNSDRARNLMTFAKVNGYDPRSLKGQLAYTDWELRNTHTGALDGLMKARTPTEAAAAFVTGFERPKGSDRGAQYSHGWGKRDAHANAIFNAFGNSTAPQVPAQATAASAAAPARSPATSGFEILPDDPADVPAAGAIPTGFFVPPGGRDGSPAAAQFELLPDEPAKPAAAAPAEPARPRVRVTLGTDAPDPEREARIAEYEKQARAAREQMNPIARTADTVARGVARAVPFMDDIAAAGDYYIAGQGSSYQDALDRQRAMNRVDDADRPVTSYGAQIGAGLALPGGALASSGLKGAAAVGAGYGALYGAGAGDGAADRANRAITGGALGGAIGAGGSAALTGLGAGARFVADKAGIPLGIARGAVNPEAEAARRIGMAAQRDAAASGDDAALMAWGREQGQPITLLDDGGEATRALGRSAANTSPEARQALQSVIADRNEAQSTRIGDFVQRLTGTSGDPAGVRETLQQQARAANRPAYARAYAQGAGGLWDEELQSLTAAPAVQQAIARASRTGANRAVADGFRPPVSPFARNADGTYALRQAANGEVAYPSLQFWDHVKRNLDDAVSTAQRRGANSEAADLTALRDGLVSKLDGMAPAYADARAGAAKFFGARDASEAGEKFLAANMTTPDARRAVAKLSAPERQLFADGFSSALISRLQGLSDRRDAVNAIFSSPKARERVEIALGREKASQLEAFLRIENVMTQAGRAITGNSTTARQLVEAGLAGGVGAAGGFTFGSDGKDVALGAIMGGLARKGALKIDARVAQRVGEMLSSTDPEALRKVVEQVGRQPAYMRAVQGFEEWLSANLPKVAQPSAPSTDVIGAPARLLGPSAGFASQNDQQ